MNHYKFKIGNLVKCISNHSSDHYCKNKIGKIIKINKINNPRSYTVKFFKPIKGGHNGRGIGSIRDGIGKDGHCWWLKKEHIELYPPILKIFLKEKNKEIK